MGFVFTVLGLLFLAYLFYLAREFYFWCIIKKIKAQGEAEKREKEQMEIRRLAMEEGEKSRGNTETQLRRFYNVSSLEPLECSAYIASRRRQDNQVEK